jgi:hypothetical protein
MLDLGESGRYEFKRIIDVVTPKQLAALANWVAVDTVRDAAHLLVGVDEEEDVRTGLVRGVPCGLPKGLDKAVSRIQEMAKLTRPIPVDAFIVEEAVATPVPFVRVEIRPTMPPHFDDEGRRQTRQGRSTRALTDDELLRIYLDREAGSFAERFRQAGAELQRAVGDVGSQVDEMATAIEQRIAKPLEELVDTADYAAIAASSAEDSANTVAHGLREVEGLVRELGEVVDDLLEESSEAVAARLVRQRQIVWWNFTLDTWRRSSSQAQRLSSALYGLLSRDIPLDDERNAWELSVWRHVLDDRKAERRAIGSLKWWWNITDQVAGYVEGPVYRAPALPDLRSELRADFEGARDNPNSLTQTFAKRLRE